MPKFNRFIRPILLLVIIVIFLSAPTPVFGAAIVVDTTIDLMDANGGSCFGMTIGSLPGADGLISLREAICAANGTVGADVITVPAGIFTLDPGEGDLDIVSDLTLNGAGIDKTIIQASSCDPTAGVCTHTNGVFLISNPGTDAALSNLTIRHGQAAGGAIYLVGTPTTLDLVSVGIKNNVSPTHGGGIFNLSGTINNISKSIFTGNEANFFGGGIYNEFGTVNEISLTTFEGNSAVLGGGGIYSRFGSVVNTISESTFKGNSAQNGGGIGHDAYILDSVIGNIFSGNTAVSGAGIYLESTNVVNISNNTFSKNIGSYRGGGIASFYTDIVSIDNNTFSENSASIGSGIYNDTGTITYIRFATFSDNDADYGGAIYNLDSQIDTIANSTFYGNSAISDGGGIWTNGPILNIVSSTFSKNFAAKGGGIYDDGLYLNIINTTISGNIGGTGLYLKDTMGYGPITVLNSIISGNSGGDCTIDGGMTFSADTSNIDSDGSCDSAVQKTISEINLSALADNGGPTKTMALLPGSHAIDTGNPTTCANSPVNNKDQRGVTRPVDGDSVPGAICDVGAFEYTGDDSALFVVSSTPSKGSTVQDVTQITVKFSKDVVSNGGATAANNPSNYLLFEKGPNGSFDTISCFDGIQTDDTQITIDAANYNSATFTATLDINGGVPLPDGKYRLLVCGTTSIFDLIGLELNGGLADSEIEFIVGVSTGAATTLPETGFALGQVTRLPNQPAELAYTGTEMILHIPSSGVSIPIVGVPQKGQSWDVTWLGNNAGYLYGSAFPTTPGNTVLTGHVWNANNSPGPFAAVKHLSHGDKFEIHAWGYTYTYEVRESMLLRSNQITSVFSHQEYDWVTLLTCEYFNPLSGNYLFRRAVQAVLVSIDIE